MKNGHGKDEETAKSGENSSAFVSVREGIREPVDSLKNREKR